MWEVCVTYRGCGSVCVTYRVCGSACVTYVCVVVCVCDVRMYVCVTYRA